MFQKKVFMTWMSLSSMVTMTLAINTQVLQFIIDPDITVVFTCQTLERFIGCLRNSNYSDCYADTLDNCSNFMSIPAIVLVNKTHHLPNSSMHDGIGRNFFRDCTATRVSCTERIACKGVPSRPEYCKTLQGLGQCNTYNLPSVKIYTSLKYEVLNANLLSITDCESYSTTSTLETVPLYDTTLEKSDDNNSSNNKTTYIAVGVSVGVFLLLVICLAIFLSRRYFNNKLARKQNQKSISQHKSGSWSANGTDNTVKQDEHYNNIDVLAEPKGKPNINVSLYNSSLIYDRPKYGNVLSAYANVDISENDKVCTNEELISAPRRSILNVTESENYDMVRESTTIFTGTHEHVYNEYGDTTNIPTNKDIERKNPDVVNTYSKLGAIDRVKKNPYNVVFNTNANSLTKD